MADASSTTCAANRHQIDGVDSCKNVQAQAKDSAGFRFCKRFPK
jgi:hypothetical protein